MALQTILLFIGIFITGWAYAQTQAFSNPKLTGFGSAPIVMGIGPMLIAQYWIL